ncbi:MAG: hypothetical protein ACE5FJ_08915 [Gemmatimonadales bacterium]
MTKAAVLALITVILVPSGLSAQDARRVAMACGDEDCPPTVFTPERQQELQARADSLRGSIDCPSEVEWPPLPSSGRTIVATDNPTRTDVVVPQYAFYYHAGQPGNPACLPVILVQADGPVFGWTAVLAPPPAAGGAFEHFFDLLGTETP